MRITEAARRLGTSARMLRYREELGLLPEVRDRLAVRAGSYGPAGSHWAPGSRGAAGSLGGAAGSLGAAGSRGARGAAGAHGAAHRQFSEADLEAVAAALELERRYDISPASLAFGL